METKKSNKVVYGLFETRAALENAVGRLKADGFLSSDISALLPTAEGSKEFAHQKDIKAPEGAIASIATGAFLGGALSWLAGIGTLAIPGMGPFIAAGPILATLGGLDIGGIAGALIGMGIPEYEAKRFESCVREDGMLLSVHTGTGEWISRTTDIFKQCGAHDVSSISEDRDELDDMVDGIYESNSKAATSEKRF